MDDLLWPHFQPLWRDLVAASSTNILVAGGYGLFLKQRWLSSSASLPTVVPIPNWLDTAPRVTKDVDLVLGLDLIKDASHQKPVVSALTQNGFEASDRESEQRWKFLKRLSGDQLIVVEMHAQRPDPDLDGITATDIGWSTCAEPSEAGGSLQACLQAANHLSKSIDSLVAASNPNVVLVFVPDRWTQFRGYQNDQERFDLHDFVKAYCIQKGIATQFLEEHTLTSNQQCRVWWWLSLACYAKSMRTPWALTSLDPNAAFVGLGFTIDRYAAKGQQIVLGCSHLYNAQGQGLQFRLSKIENPIIRNRNPHMSYDDARQVAESIRQLFFESQSRLPPRVVIHKQTPFLRDEKQGLLDGLKGVASIDLLEIQVDSTLRYVSSVQKTKRANGEQISYFDDDNFPIRRGTVVKLDDRRALVWCHGVTDSVKIGWKYFQGKRHIPSPLIVTRHAGRTDLESIAFELLGLSKMDWNSADMYSKLPATIDSSRQIARIGAKLQRFGPISYDYRLFM